MAASKQSVGHSPKGKGTDRVLESAIQREICDYLRSRGHFFWRSNNVPVFSTSNDGVRRFRSLPKDTPRGIPDIMMLYRGRFVCLEVKRPGAKLRPEQADFACKVLLHDGVFFVVHSVEEVKAYESRGFVISPRGDIQDDD